MDEEWMKSDVKYIAIYIINAGAIVWCLMGQYYGYLIVTIT